MASWSTTCLSLELHDECLWLLVQSVINLRVTADNLAAVCDLFPNTLAGIRLDAANGAITNNTVTGIQQGPNGDGCQEGEAIDARNAIGTGTP